MTVFWSKPAADRETNSDPGRPTYRALPIEASMLLSRTRSSNLHGPGLRTYIAPLRPVFSCDGDRFRHESCVTSRHIFAKILICQCLAGE